MITSANPRGVYRNGYKPGCLPRKSKPGEWCPMAAERIKIIPSVDWDEAAKELGDSVRQHVPVVLDQNGYRSCACESATGAVMLARAIAGLPFVLLNPLFVYHTTSGGRDNGSSIDENLAFIREHGIAPESVWPRSKGFQAKPSTLAIEAAKEFRIEEFFDIANVNEMVSSELTGYAVVYGADGHSVLKIQHLSAKEGLDLNSWKNSNWGDGGFGVWATYNSVDFSYGAWAVRVASSPQSILRPLVSTVGTTLPTPEESRAYCLSRCPDIANAPWMFLRDGSKLAMNIEVLLKSAKLEAPQ